MCVVQEVVRLRGQVSDLERDLVRLRFWQTVQLNRKSEQQAKATTITGLETALQQLPPPAPHTSSTRAEQLQAALQRLEGDAKRAQDAMSAENAALRARLEHAIEQQTTLAQKEVCGRLEAGCFCLDHHDLLQAGTLEAMAQLRARAETAEAELVSGLMFSYLRKWPLTAPPIDPY
jgi:hypothetical protein